MYAIRSYYETAHEKIADNQTGKKPAQISEKACAAVSHTEGIAKPAHEETGPENPHGRTVGREIAHRMERPPVEAVIVITSYSIHYTKLYDPLQQAIRLYHRRSR